MSITLDGSSCPSSDDPPGGLDKELGPGLQQTGERPAVAVWTAAQTATFLTAVAEDQLFPLST